MCDCKAHYDRTAPCTCSCNHGYDSYITAESIVAGDAVSVVGVSEEGYLVGKLADPPRTKRIIYKHAHNCSTKNDLFIYRPATQGNVMLAARPICADTGDELMFVRMEDDV